jgi:hypothetical protein
MEALVRNIRREIKLLWTHRSFALPARTTTRVDPVQVLNG